MGALGGRNISEEGNLAAVSQFVEEAWNEGDQAAVDRFVSKDHTFHPVGRPDLTGPAGVKAYIAEVRRGFPDVHIAAEDAFARGNRVAVRWKITGTHEGEYEGIPPTGRHASIGCLSLFRLRNGKIVENWLSPDRLSLLQQLGVIPGA